MPTLLSCRPADPIRRKRSIWLIHLQTFLEVIDLRKKYDDLVPVNYSVRMTKLNGTGRKSLNDPLFFSSTTTFNIFYPGYGTDNMKYRSSFFSSLWHLYDHLNEAIAALFDRSIPTRSWWDSKSFNLLLAVLVVNFLVLEKLFIILSASLNPSIIIKNLVVELLQPRNFIFDSTIHAEQQLASLRLHHLLL